MIRLEPSRPYLSSPTQPTTEPSPQPSVTPAQPISTQPISTQPISTQPISTQPTPIQDSGFGEPISPPSDRRFILPRYAGYEFAPDGTPYRTTQPTRGPRVILGKVDPLFTTSTRRYFSLRIPGGRETKSDMQIRQMIEGSDTTPHDLYTLKRFPQLRFDKEGRAYSLKTHRECSYSLTTDTNGFPVRNYVLCTVGPDAPIKRYKITDAIIRRMLSGKIGEDSITIPDSFKQLDGEFIDFALDQETFELYRIGSRSATLLEPRLMHKSKANGQYTLTNASGDVFRFTRRQLLARAGIDESHPRFEEALRAGASK